MRDIRIFGAVCGKRWTGRQWILLCLGCLLLAGPVLAAEDMNAAIRYYRDGDFPKARLIAKENMEGSPLAQLIYYLCPVFENPNNTDAIASGLEGLKPLYEDTSLKSAHPDIWAEAALVYGRVIHLAQIRKQLDQYAGMDVRKVYRDIIAGVPEGEHACMAAMYMGETYLATEDKALQDEGFAFVEKFLKAYKGAPKNTVPVHLYIEGYYINLHGDYEKSYEHLKKAYEIGITKEVLARVTLFRMARMCDIKVNRPMEAKKLYEKFIELYPNGLRTPVAKRYLQELQERLLQVNP
ncbi:MAG: hypothetical protein V1918_09665 [Planctomycetota bacterium]